MTAVVLLTRAEAGSLAECEEKIRAGLQTFVEVGTALATIRDNRLYRAEYGSFEQYVEDRWQLSRAHAYRMIVAADAVSPIGDTDLPMPTNEGQARELARTPASDRADVWRETVERTNGKPTAAAIADVRHEREQTIPTPAPTTEPSRRENAEPLRDAASSRQDTPPSTPLGVEPTGPALPWPVAEDTPRSANPGTEIAHAARVSDDVRRLITLAHTFGSQELRSRAVQMYADHLGHAPMPPSGAVNADELRKAGEAILALAKDWKRNKR
jgi:hypothetical protein